MVITRKNFNYNPDLSQRRNHVSEMMGLKSATAETTMMLHAL
jgi:hypothetical protein